MKYIEVITIIIFHYISDFVLQSDEDAKGKSTNNHNLTNHVLMYSMIWIIASLIYCAFTLTGWMLLFVPITFCCHWVQDYITSREVKKRFDKHDYHNGFVIIGFDQLLHYIQLFGFYILLK